MKSPRYSNKAQRPAIRGTNTPKREIIRIAWQFGFFLLSLFLLDDELLVVIDEEGSHGEGDNHAEDAEEGAPDGERQEDDG